MSAVATAVVHSEPPLVYLAEDLDTLHRLLANLTGAPLADTADA